MSDTTYEGADERAEVWFDPTELEADVDYGGKCAGCCGMDGCDGPNRACGSCKTLVGTESSDCWTPSLFVVHAETTRWIPANKDAEEEIMEEEVMEEKAPPVAGGGAATEEEAACPPMKCAE